jgi:hypothetical protein
MFVYSLKAGTVKFFGVLCVALVALITVIAFVPEYDGAITTGGTVETREYNYDKVKTDEDRREFLSQFGWEVSGEAVEVREIRIPEEFDKIFGGYNEIQRAQGLDLAKYKRKTVKRYTYEISNYEGYDGKVLVNILVYRNRVIGGDICSADRSGFVTGFEGN